MIMNFNEPEFHANVLETPAGLLCVNMTVRKGISWATKVKTGSEIYLYDVNDREQPVATALVWDVKVMPFNALSIPQYRQMLQCHHLDRGRIYQGLFNEMKKCYDGFVSAEIVTLVFFTITSQRIDGKRAETESE